MTVLLLLSELYFHLMQRKSTKIRGIDLEEILWGICSRGRNSRLGGLLRGLHLGSRWVGRSSSTTLGLRLQVSRDTLSESIPVN